MQHFAQDATAWILSLRPSTDKKRAQAPRDSSPWSGVLLNQASRLHSPPCLDPGRLISGFQGTGGRSAWFVRHRDSEGVQLCCSFVTRPIRGIVSPSVVGLTCSNIHSCCSADSVRRGRHGVRLRDNVSFLFERLLGLKGSLPWSDRH